MLLQLLSRFSNKYYNIRISALLGGGGARNRILVLIKPFGVYLCGSRGGLKEAGRLFESLRCGDF